MRNARSMFPLGRKALGVVLAGWICCCGWGCHQHHYYYYGGQGAGACPPATIVPSTVAGPVCEIPSTVDSAPVVSSRATTTIQNGRKSRVVVSEPSSSSSRSARFGWRSAEYDDAPAMTHVEGGLDETVVK